jgi:hypothetical protein
MQPAVRLLLALIVVAAVVGGGYYLWQRQQSQQQTPPAPATDAATPPSSAAPVVQHPIEEAGVGSKEGALPALADSDPALRTSLASFFPKSWEQFFLLDGFVRRIVATVDALPRKSVPQRVSPVKSVPGSFLTAGQAEGLLIARENSARYVPYLKLAEAVDTRRLVAVYVWYYPLFQQAYAELGYPNAYFNDRLIATIDDLLSAPDAPDAVPLTQPKVLYEYADPELEALSAGQKIMLRMGGENEVRAKAKLRDIRRALTAKSAQPSP